MNILKEHLEEIEKQNYTVTSTSPFPQFTKYSMNVNTADPIPYDRVYTTDITVTPDIKESYLTVTTPEPTFLDTIQNIYNWLELAGNKFGDESKRELAMNLVKEEYDETYIAYLKNDNDQIKDGVLDLIWMLSNLTYFSGIPVSEINDMMKKVEQSNFSKFCTSEQEAVETILAYENGTHWDKPEVKIGATFEKVNDYFVIKRIGDGKILKSLYYKPVSEL